VRRITQDELQQEGMLWDANSSAPICKDRGYCGRVIRQSSLYIQDIHCSLKMSLLGAEVTGPLFRQPFKPAAKDRILTSTKAV
jgi:hypothetical protein